MSEKQPKDEKDEILELIRWIDKQKCKLFKKWDALRGWWLRISIIGLIAIVISLFIFNVAISYSSWVSHTIDLNLTLNSAAVSIAVLAVALSFFSLAVQLSQENVIRINFEKALTLRQFNPHERILLKALIKIKAKNQEFELEELYKEHKAMFAREKLLETLCE